MQWAHRRRKIAMSAVPRVDLAGADEVVLRVRLVHAKGIEEHFAVNARDEDVSFLYQALALLIAGTEGPESGTQPNRPLLGNAHGPDALAGIPEQVLVGVAGVGAKMIPRPPTNAVVGDLGREVVPVD